MIRFRNMTSVVTVRVVSSGTYHATRKIHYEKRSVTNSQNPGDKDKCKDKQT